MKGTSVRCFVVPRALSPVSNTPVRFRLAFFLAHALDLEGLSVLYIESCLFVACGDTTPRITAGAARWAWP